MTYWGGTNMDPIRGNLVATINDKTMTWTSTPPGQKINKPLRMAFSPQPSNLDEPFKPRTRQFTIMPDGTAR
jgi:hypothetical protein